MSSYLTTASASSTYATQTALANVLNGTTSFTNLNYTGFLNGVAPTNLGYVSTLTSSAQGQINGIINGLTSIQQNYQYIHSAFGPITLSQSISAPYYEAYSIATSSTTAITLTLPAPSATVLGLKLTFRRVNATAAAVNSSQGYYPFTSNAATSTVLLTASATTQAGNQISIVCLQNASTYAWYQIP